MAAKQESMTTTAGQGDGQQLKKQFSKTNESLSLHKTNYVMLTVGQSTVFFLRVSTIFCIATFS